METPSSFGNHHIHISLKAPPNGNANGIASEIAACSYEGSATRQHLWSKRGRNHLLSQRICDFLIIKFQRETIGERGNMTSRNLPIAIHEHCSKHKKVFSRFFFPLLKCTNSICLMKVISSF